VQQPRKAREVDLMEALTQPRRQLVPGSRRKAD